MATTIRDPYFWKRFSIAAHQQEDVELAQQQQASEKGAKQE